MPSSEPIPAQPQVPPPLALLDLVTGKWISQAISVAAKLGIADLLRDGPKPCDELARANQVDAQSLYRLLRATASFGVFAEVGDKEFALTPMAECLRSDVPGSLRGMATMSGEDLFWRPWGDLLTSVKTGEPAFARVFGKGLFEALPEFPATAAIFDEAMTGWSAQEAAAVVAAYDFAPFGTVIDVGGGQGLLLATILKAHPRLRGVLFETPSVIQAAQERVKAVGLSDRIKTVAGDFFGAVPGGGDAYLLKHVIHDWDDERAVKILSSCRHAMGSHGRLLVVEMVIPPGNDRFLGKLLDLEMLVIAGGQERTEAEYRDLLAMAEFRMSRIVPTSSASSVIEGLPV